MPAILAGIVQGASSHGRGGQIAAIFYRLATPAVVFLRSQFRKQVFQETNMTASTFSIVTATQGHPLFSLSIDQLKAELKKEHAAFVASKLTEADGAPYWAYRYQISALIYALVHNEDAAGVPRYPVQELFNS
jgi:hypothetical protein